MRISGSNDGGDDGSGDVVKALENKNTLLQQTNDKLSGENEIEEELNSCETERDILAERVEASQCEVDSLKKAGVDYSSRQSQWKRRSVSLKKRSSS